MDEDLQRLPSFRGGRDLRSWLLVRPWWVIVETPLAVKRLRGPSSRTRAWEWMQTSYLKNSLLVWYSKVGANTAFSVRKMNLVRRWNIDEFCLCGNIYSWKIFESLSKIINRLATRIWVTASKLVWLGSRWGISSLDKNCIPVFWGSLQPWLGYG